MQLAERYRPRLLVVLDRLLLDSRPRIDPEDVAQEALAKAFQHLGRFDLKFRFSTWLYSIAFRVARDHQRRNRKWSRLLFLGSSDVLAAQRHAADQVSLSERAGGIWSLAKQLLTADQYAALWLRYGEELELGEISEILSKKQGTIRVLLHRSRLALVKHIESVEMDHPKSGKEGNKIGALER